MNELGKSLSLTPDRHSFFQFKELGSYSLWPKVSHLVATVGGDGQRLQSRCSVQSPSSGTDRTEMTLGSLGSMPSFYNTEEETETKWQEEFKNSATEFNFQL